MEVKQVGRGYHGLDAVGTLTLLDLLTYLLRISACCASSSRASSASLARASRSSAAASALAAWNCRRSAAARPTAPRSCLPLG